MNNNSQFNMNNSVQPPEGYRSVPLVIIFTIITFGIYSLYWVYKVSQQINRELLTGKEPVVQLLLYMFIPFYSWYWIYTTTENITEFAYRRGRHTDTSLAVVNLVVSIFGFAIVAIALMQDAINKAVGEYEGANYDKARYGGNVYQNAYSNNNYQNQYSNNGNQRPSANNDIGAGYTYAPYEPVEENVYAKPVETVETETITEVKPEEIKRETVQNEPELVIEPKPEVECEVATEPELVIEPKTIEPETDGEEIAKLKALLDDGILSQEEFDKLKQKFM